MRVRVCDDVQTIADGWVTAIGAVTPDGYDVARMPDAKSDVSKLLLRKLAVENGDDPMAIDCGFDGIDVLAVDYDLLHLDEEGGRTTGEGVARLARTYSTCGAIVVMNQYKGPQFDLGMRGHLDSYADINVDAGLVGRAALWTNLAPADGQFDPTTWTPLPNLLAAARSLSSTFEEAGLDAVVTPATGLAEGGLAQLSDTAFGFVDLKAKTAGELATVSLRTFLLRWLGADLVATLEARAPKLLFDFGGFRMVKWLDRAVLRPMDLLVDGAHLIDRLPFMIDPAKVDVANATAWTQAAADPAGKLRWAILEKYLNVGASRALGQTVFDWYRLADDDEIDTLQDAYLTGENERFYLAEDTSRFIGRDAVTRYRADFHNFGDRRAIEKLADITYGPMRRVSFG